MRRRQPWWVLSVDRDEAVRQNLPSILATVRPGNVGELRERGALSPGEPRPAPTSAPSSGEVREHRIISWWLWLAVPIALGFGVVAAVLASGVGR